MALSRPRAAGHTCALTPPPPPNPMPPRHRCAAQCAGAQSLLHTYYTLEFRVTEDRFLKMAEQQAAPPKLCGISLANRSVLLLPLLRRGRHVATRERITLCWLGATGPALLCDRHANMHSACYTTGAPARSLAAAAAACHMSGLHSDRPAHTGARAHTARNARGKALTELKTWMQAPGSPWPGPAPCC